MCVRSAAFVMQHSPETCSESYSPLSLLLNWRTSHSVAVIILTNSAAVCFRRASSQPQFARVFCEKGILGNVGSR